jgi:hypothetical protein
MGIDACLTSLFTPRVALARSHGDGAQSDVRQL